MHSAVIRINEVTEVFKGMCLLVLLFWVGFGFVFLLQVQEREGVLMNFTLVHSFSKWFPSHLFFSVVLIQGSFSSSL